jgi:putative transposase
VVSATGTAGGKFENLRFSYHTAVSSMTEIKKAWHNAYDIHYHLVLPVKYRKALLNEAITKSIKNIALGIQERYQVVYEQLGCDLDHIHILCGAHPKYGPGALVRVFKSITAKQLFKLHPELKKELWGGEFWSDGYYVATVGTGGNWSVVERYVKNQGKSLEQLKLL